MDASNLTVFQIIRLNTKLFRNDISYSLIPNILQLDLLVN